MAIVVSGDLGQPAARTRRRVLRLSRTAARTAVALAVPACVALTSGTTYAATPERVHPALRAAPLGPATAASTGTARLSGADRYETSALISGRAFPGGASTVYLASGTNPSDAVAAGTLTDGPILLTTPTGVTDPVAEEIKRLNPKRIVALGGTKAISDVVIKTVVIKTVVIKTVVIKTSSGAEAARVPGQVGDDEVVVERLGGADRYETAVAISRRAFPQGSPEAYLASGTGLADAVAGGALTRGPILLTPPGQARADVTAEIQRLNPAKVVALGGSAAISNIVIKTSAGSRETARLAGADRYETAAQVATYAAPTGAGAAYLANGRSLVDALSAGSLRDGPVVLIDPDRPATGQPALTALASIKPATVVGLGGPAAVSDQLLSAAAAAVDRATAVQLPAATPTTTTPRPPSPPSPPTSPPTPPEPVLAMDLSAGTAVAVDDDSGYPRIADPGEVVTFRFTVTNTSNVALLDMSAAPSPGSTPVTVTPERTDRVEPGASVTFRASYRIPDPPTPDPATGPVGEVSASLDVTAIPQRCPGTATACPITRTVTSTPVPTLPLRIVGKPEVIDEDGGTPGVLDPGDGDDPGEDTRWVWTVTNLTDRPIDNVTVSFKNVNDGDVLTTTPNTATIPARGTATFIGDFAPPANDYLASPLEMFGRAGPGGPDGVVRDLAPWARAGVPVNAPPATDRG